MTSTNGTIKHCTQFKYYQIKTESNNWLCDSCKNGSQTKELEMLCKLLCYYSNGITLLNYSSCFDLILNDRPDRHLGSLLFKMHAITMSLPMLPLCALVKIMLHKRLKVVKNIPHNFLEPEAMSRNSLCCPEPRSKNLKDIHISAMFTII